MHDFLIVATIFGTVYGIVFLLIRKKERQLMIEKGIDPALFMKERPTSSSLKWGMFMIFIALGILIGEILSVTTTLDEGASYFSMVLIFGGTSLLFYYFLAKKENREHGNGDKSGGNINNM